MPFLLSLPKGNALAGTSVAPTVANQGAPDGTGHLNARVGAIEACFLSNGWNSVANEGRPKMDIPNGLQGSRRPDHVRITHVSYVVPRSLSICASKRLAFSASAVARGPKASKLRKAARAYSRASVRRPAPANVLATLDRV